MMPAGLLRRIVWPRLFLLLILVRISDTPWLRIEEKWVQAVLLFAAALLSVAKHAVAEDTSKAQPKKTQLPIRRQTWAKQSSNPRPRPPSETASPAHIRDFRRPPFPSPTMCSAERKFRSRSLSRALSWTPSSREFRLSRRRGNSQTVGTNDTYFAGRGRTVTLGVASKL